MINHPTPAKNTTNIANIPFHRKISHQTYRDPQPGLFSVDCVSSFSFTMKFKMYHELLCIMLLDGM